MKNITIATGSATTKKVYRFLKQNEGKSFTYAEIAEKLGFDKVASVLGSTNSLVKKGVVANGEEVVRKNKQGLDATYKTVTIVPGVEVAFEDVATKSTGISDKGKALLEAFRANPEPRTAADVADEMSLAAIAVNGVANALVKRGLMERVVEIVSTPEGEREIKLLRITDEGIAYKE